MIETQTFDQKCCIKANKHIEGNQTTFIPHSLSMDSTLTSNNIEQPQSVKLKLTSNNLKTSPWTKKTLILHPTHTHICATYNLLLNSGFYPTISKSALMTVIPRKGANPSYLLNYRHISVFICLGKLLEKKNHNVTTILSQNKQIIK